MDQKDRAVSTARRERLGAQGLPGRGLRRAAAAGALALGLLDVVLAAAREPAVRLGPVEIELAEQTVAGFRYLLLAAALVLLSTARGLLRGKRQAWTWALAGAVASLLAHHLKRADALGDMVALGLLGLLLAGRRWFPARSDPATARRGLVWLAVGEAAVFAYGAAGIYLLDAQFRDPTTLVESIVNAASLLFVLPPTSVTPATHHGAWFVDSVRVLALAVLAIGIVRTLRSVVLAPARAESDRARVRALLERHATTSLAFFHLHDDKHHFFADDGQALISYKVVGSVAVALGEPIGEPAACRAVAAAFARHCDLNGWRFCYHQATPEGAAWLGETGLRALKLGEEAVIDVVSFSLASPHFKSVRNKTAKLTRDGVTVEELTQPVDEATMAELAEVSEAWLAEGGHRERTFTVGRFDPDYLRSTEVLVARSPGGRIEAFVNVLPTFGSTEGNFDLMRRRPDAPRSVMDLLFLHLIERFRSRGLTGMNLGLAPLANIEGDGMAARALRLLYDRGEQAFHFRGLQTFKQKWLPRWEPCYLLYRSEVQLPELAVAVTRAGELGRPSPSPFTRLVGTSRRLGSAARRLPVSLGLITGIVGLELLAADVGTHRWLRDHLAVSWADVEGLRLWRLLTATFVQEKPGLRLSIVVLLAVLPAVEWRLGSARTAVAFFLGDWLSTVGALAAARLLGALGSGLAMEMAYRPQLGSSSATLAAIAAMAAHVPDRRRRRRFQVLLGVGLVGILVLFNRLFDWEHLLAGAVGTALGWRARRRSDAAGAGASDPAPAPAGLL